MSTYATSPTVHVTAMCQQWGKVQNAPLYTRFRTIPAQMRRYDLAFP
jgi:hypothetical protein